MDLKKLQKNKRGSLTDLIFLGVVLTFFAVIILIGFMVISNFNTQLQASVPGLPTEAVTSLNTIENTFSGTLDNTFFFFAIGLGIVTIVLAALVRVHPIFIAFYIVGLVFTIFFSGVFSTIYQEMAASPTLSTYASQLNIINTTMTYLPWVVAIIGTLLAIIMYKNWKVGNDFY